MSREIERAVAKGLFVVPFRIEDVPMSKTMEYFLSSPHWLDAITPPFEQHLQVLVRTVKALLNPSPQVAAAPQAADPATPMTAARSTVGGDSSQGTSWRASWTTHRRRVAWAMGALAATVVLVALAASSLSGRKPDAQAGRELAAAGSHAAGTAAVSAPPAPGPQKTQDALEQSPSAKGKLTGASLPPSPSLGKAADAPETASSQFALRGGPLVCRSEGLKVRFLSKGAPAEGEGPDARRLLLVTNQRDLPVSEVDQEMAADLSFQINNQSAETVTLSQIQVLLLGVIPCYEDQIAEPQAPRVAEPIKDLTVQEDAPPRKEYADLRVVFADDDTPSEDLQYQIVETTHPEVATAIIVR